MVVIEEALESFVRETICFMVDSSLNVCKEIFKFLLVLLLLHYLAVRSFQFLEHFLQEINGPSENQDNLKTLLDLGIRQAGETSVRIGAPDENLIQQRANLLEQLEIEAEFEENLEKHIKSETKPTVSKTRDVDYIASLKDPFIAQIKRESNESSQATQTIKTSLGKKSKPRDVDGNVPTTSNDAYNEHEEKDEKLLANLNINEISEINKDPNIFVRPKRETTSSDEEDFHDSSTRM